MSGARRPGTVVEEHTEGSRGACRKGIVSVSAGDDADEPVRCLESKSAAAEERDSVGGCSGDLTMVEVSVSEEENGGDGDGESTKPTKCVAGAPYRCVARRTRAVSGKKNRVSYGQYFDEEESAKFAVADYSKRVSEKRGKGKGKVLEILVNGVESSVNVKDDKSDTMSQIGESGENVRAGKCKSKMASKGGGVASWNVDRKKLEMATQRGGESNNVKAEESDTLSQKGGIEEGSEVYVKTKYGISLLVTCGGSEKAVGSEATSKSESYGPARRTRSRFRSSVSDKLRNLGTVSKPLCLDEDDPEAKGDSGLPSSDGVDLMDSGGRAKMDLVLCSPDVVNMIDPREGEEESGSGKHADVEKRKGQGRGSKSRIRKRVQTDSGFPCFNGGERIGLDGKVEVVGNRMNMDGAREGTRKRRVQMKSTSKRSKTVQSLKDNDYFKILKDSLWNCDKKLPEEFIKEKTPVNVGSESQTEAWQNLLLPIFCFEDEKPEQVEKSEYEKEIDDLWAELDLVLEANNIGTMIYQGDKGQTNEICELEMESDPFSSCSKGKHQFILDEQIGRMCKFCSSVEVHIKGIMPPWASQFAAKVKALEIA